MIGEKDDAYGRRERCERFNEAIQKLKEENKGDYPVAMEFKKGFGHGGLPDRDKIKEMYPFTRQPVPRHLTWELTDPVVRHFYWLSVSEPGGGQSVDAMVQDNTARITTRKVKQLEIALDSRLVDFSKALRINLDGSDRVVTIRPRLLTLCQSMVERGDPNLAFACRIPLKVEKK
jgi:hypothetical protein